MKLRWICAFAVLGALGALPAAWAAPDRLNDDVPDAVPDQEGALAASYNYQALQLEGPLNSSSAAQQLFKLRYTFSPDVAASFRYQSLSLAGGPGIFSPIYDNADGAMALDFDLALNLLNVAATPADATKKTEWAAGSAFGIGLNAARYTIDQGPLAQDDTLLKAYLTYSTDLTDKMRAHTYFSSGRLSGDSHSGSVNRVAAGLDYTITPGCHPLVVMANGVLDVYNFRQPAFNTNRITRFDLGMRYRFAEDWYASLGWTTLNDSENDASGSGLFAGLNFVDEPPCCEPCIECPPAPPADPNAPPATPPAQAAVPAAAGQPGKGGLEAPLLMAQAYPVQSAEVKSASGSLPGPATGPALPDASGISIPALELPSPVPTPQGALMARAPVSVQAEPETAIPQIIALAPAAPDALVRLKSAGELRPSAGKQGKEINAARESDSAAGDADESPEHPD